MATTLFHRGGNHTHAAPRRTAPGPRSARAPAPGAAFPAVRGWGRARVGYRRRCRQIARVAESLGACIGPENWVAGVRNQSIFHASQFGLFGSGWRKEGNRIGVAYLHGQPGTPGMPEFDICFDELRDRHAEIDRVQVSCRAMEKLVLAAGIEPDKVVRIPIGIDLEHFPFGEPDAGAAGRRELGLPESAFVVGSFQKDGVGWGDGLEPKLIKGPDVFLDVLARIRERVPEIFVLLTGPARGFAQAGLERIGVPYRHVVAGDRTELAGLYRMLDAYLVASRDEGGPKAVLESMASGVPLVSTRVGQAADLVVHGENGYLADVEDPDGTRRLPRRDRRRARGRPRASPR